MHAYRRVSSSLGVYLGLKFGDNPFPRFVIGRIGAAYYYSVWRVGTYNIV